MNKLTHHDQAGHDAVVNITENNTINSNFSAVKRYEKVETRFKQTGHTSHTTDKETDRGELKN